MKKWINSIFLGLFSAVLITPMVLFNFKSEVVSEIDNRMLAENPFKTEGDLTQNIENYVNDRIGLRDEMILGYTLLNDKIFAKMVHPSYTYGKDGYVFGSGVTTCTSYTEYHQTFAKMVKTIQTYCEERNVPFLFVFNPAKPAVYTEYIAAGINYDRVWVEKFLQDLDAMGVRYLDNTVTMKEKKEAGEVVFNKKYDANHWNAIGAYYGTKAALIELQKDFPSINVVEKEQLQITEVVEKSLHVSKFPINEKVPVINIEGYKVQWIHKTYDDELYRHPSHRGYLHGLNKAHPESPKALVFQGSYMNKQGYQYFANAFGEYIGIHDYENVIDFPYYYNIFQPQCVVFEVAEYTIKNSFFNFDAMKNLRVNPCLEKLSSEQKSKLIKQTDWNVERNKELTKITIPIEDNSYAWLKMNKTYDMKKAKNGYEVTVLTSEYDLYKEEISIVVLEENDF